jgi:hypothetical protein
LEEGATVPFLKDYSKLVGISLEKKDMRGAIAEGLPEGSSGFELSTFNRRSRLARDSRLNLQSSA